MIFSAEQNHYPDVTFVTKNKKKIALDLKSTYRKNHEVKKLDYKYVLSNGNSKEVLIIAK